MSGFVVVVQKYTHVTKRDDRDVPVKWKFYGFGESIELDEDDANTRRLLKVDAIVTQDAWDEAEAARTFTPDQAAAYRDRIAELEARLAEAESGAVPASIPFVPDEGTGASAGDFDDSGTADVELLKRPANAASVDKWRAYAAAKVTAEDPADLDDQLAKIDDPATERAFLIRTYGTSAAE